MEQENQPSQLLRHGRRLRVGECRLDLALNEVHEGERTSRLTPKAAAVLEVLLHVAGQPASKERLLAEVWRGEFPTEDVVTHAIGELRRAFGDEARAPRYIRTVPRVGYALIADVGPLGQDAPEAADTAAGTASAPSAGPGAHAEDAPRRPGVRMPALRTGWIAGLAGSSLLALAVWLVPGGRGDAPPAADPGQAAGGAQVLPATSLPGGELYPALSPDASLLAYSAKVDGEGLRVFVQVPGGENPRRIAQQPADSETYPVFSPDGRQLVFQRRVGGECRFILAGVLDGVERTVGSCSPRGTIPVDWTRDGTGLLMPKASPQDPARAVLHRLDVATGEIQPLVYPRSDTQSDVQARPSPDGRYIAFRRGAVLYTDLFVMRADGTGVRQLTQLQSHMPGFAWASDSGSLVFSSDHEGAMALYRVPLEGGEVVALGIEGAWRPDIAPLRGELAFVRETSAVQIAELALDGRLDASPPLLAPASRSTSAAVHSPDGQRVALVSERSGRPGLYVVEGLTLRRLAEHEDAQIAEPRWSPDGAELLYVARSRGGRLMLVDVATGISRDATPEGHSVMSAEFSPDGRGIVFTSDASGRWQLWWQDRDGQAPPRRLTTEGGRHPAFRDAQRVVFLAGAEVGTLQQLDLATGALTDLDVPIGFRNQRAWQAERGGIYALRGADRFGIYRRDWDGGEWTLVEPLRDLPLREFRMSLDLAAGRALVTLAPQEEGDIYRVTGSQF